MVDIFSEGDGFGIELDGGAVDSADDLYSGNRINVAGYYHVTATASAIRREEGKLPQVQIDMLVLDGTDEEKNRAESQIGKNYTHYIYLAKWADKEKTDTAPLEEAAQKGIRAFAYAFGLIGEADLSRANVRIPFHMIDGRQAIVRIQKQSDYTDRDGEKRTGGYKMSWNNDAWPVTHEKVKDIAKDPSALAMLHTAGVAGGGGAATDIEDI